MLKNRTYAIFPCDPMCCTPLRYLRKSCFYSSTFVREPLGTLRHLLHPKIQGSQGNSSSTYPDSDLAHSPESPLNDAKSSLCPSQKPKRLLQERSGYKRRSESNQRQFVGNVSPRYTSSTTTGNTRHREQPM